MGEGCPFRHWGDLSLWDKSEATQELKQEQRQGRRPRGKGWKKQTGVLGPKEAGRQAKTEAKAEALWQRAADQGPTPTSPRPRDRDGHSSPSFADSSYPAPEALWQGPPVCWQAPRTPRRDMESKTPGQEAGECGSQKPRGVGVVKKEQL